MRKVSYFLWERQISQVIQQKPAEDLFTIASASIYSKASQYFGVIEDCKNLLPPKQIRRNL